MRNQEEISKMTRKWNEEQKTEEFLLLFVSFEVYFLIFLFLWFPHHPQKFPFVQVHELLSLQIVGKRICMQKILSKKITS